ncbi:MAG: riboflavin synthase [Vicingaceae bacterium]
MFTGIIETTARVLALQKEGTNLRIRMRSPITNELEIDQSVAHNGVCLTVESLTNEYYEVVAVKETLLKTNLSSLKEDSLVNLERCMKMNARLDGHIVQGHVDSVATVSEIEKEDGSYLFHFKLSEPSKLIVEKGSICINGVSLTAFNVTDNSFSVTIIPYTFEHTTFKELRAKDRVNLEFDIVGKYIARLFPAKS